MRTYTLSAGSSRLRAKVALLTSLAVFAIAGSAARSLAADSSRPTPGDDSSGGERGTDTGNTRPGRPASAPYQGGAHSSNADPSHSQLQEIVVTAERRRTRLLDTPISMSVISSSALAAMGAVSFRDFANTVPGLNYTTTGEGYTQISLRGVTSGFFPGPSVAIYVDDVPYGSSSAFAQAGQLSLDAGLFDLARVDVLRGPQGTLYGASAMGGVIKYVTTPPSLTKLEGEARAGAADIEDGRVSYNGAAVTNVPVIPGELAIRASAYYNRNGGFVDNVTLGQKDVNRSATYGGRFDALLAPTAKLRVRLTGFLQNISRDGDATVDYRMDGTPRYGPLDQSRLVAEPFEQQYRLVSAEVNYDAPFAAFTSISSYQTVRTAVDHDLSGYYLPLLASFGMNYSALGFPINYFTDKSTQEFRLVSNTKGPLQWLFGAFYTHEGSGNQQLFAPFDLSGAPAPNILYTYSAPSTFEEAAAYGDLTLHFTQRFAVTGGVRFAGNNQRYAQIGSGLFIGSEPERTSHDHVLTYLANATYHLSNDASAYARFATGYRPGGPNAVADDPLTGKPLAAPTFAPDRLDSYELGIKTQSPGGAVSFALDGYYIQWHNIQITAVRNGFGVIANAPGGATVRGSELSVTVRPLDRVTLTGAFAYQNPRLSKANTDLGAFENERLPNVPPLTASISAEYRIGELDAAPTLGATFNYVGSRSSNFILSTSQPPYALPSYKDLDLHVAFMLGALQWRLYVDNVANSRGEVSAWTGYSAPGFAQVALVPPRTVGLALTDYFGR